MTVCRVHSWLYYRQVCQVFSINHSVVVCPAASPSAPKDFKVQEVTRQHVHLMWEAPEHDGGSPLTGYQVEKRDMSRKTWVKVSSLPNL